MTAPVMAVVGSGPGGIAAAKALIRRGVRVVLFDAGQTLDETRRSLADRLARQDHRQWSPADVEELTRNHTLHDKVPKKLVFGSDFLFAGSHPACPTEAEGAVTAQPTLAQGGYSVAWGAAMMPIADEDMTAWPFRREALEPAYRRILPDMPLSAAHDALERNFPLFSNPDGRLRLPRQAAALLADVNARERCTETDTLLCGQARISVHLPEHSAEQGCRYCGLCLSGCVYKSIHTFDQTVETLVRDGALDYRPDVTVTRLGEDETGCTVTWRALDGGPEQSARFDRVFLAAGAINSTRILLDSSGRYDTQVHFLDSQKFIVPILRWRRDPVEWPDINALPSLFMEAHLPQVAPNWFHMQISPVNDFVLSHFGLKERAGLKWRLMAPAIERLMIAWCGLHSSLSGGFTGTLRRGSDGAAGVMHLTAVPNSAAVPTVKRFVRKMMVKGLGFRTLFVPLVTVSPTGGGNHFGGSFPMTASPSRFNQSDLLGRPAGWSRLHLVDGSILPSIPATTVALLIMANADRIATDVPLD